jgi:hypothetical protein
MQVQARKGSVVLALSRCVAYHMPAPPCISNFSHPLARHLLKSPFATTPASHLLSLPTLMRLIATKSTTSCLRRNNKAKAEARINKRSRSRAPNMRIPSMGSAVAAMSHWICRLCTTASGVEAVHLRQLLISCVPRLPKPTAYGDMEPSMTRLVGSGFR